MEDREESRSEAVETKGWRRVGGGRCGHWGSLTLSSPGFVLSPENYSVSERWTLDFGEGVWSPFRHSSVGETNRLPKDAMGGTSRLTLTVW